MGYHAYCLKCDNCRPKPTINEVIEGVQDCNYCGNIHKIEDWERQRAIIDIVERIEAIEAKLGIKNDV